MENKLKSIMWRNVGLIRDEKGLKNALDFIQECRILLSKRTFVLNLEDTNEFDLITYNIIKNKVQLSYFITKSALARRNSLGAHFRSDYNFNDEKYNIVLNKTDYGECSISQAYDDI